MASYSGGISSISLSAEVPNATKAPFFRSLKSCFLSDFWPLVQKTMSAFPRARARPPGGTIVCLSDVAYTFALPSISITVVPFPNRAATALPTGPYPMTSDFCVSILILRERITVCAPSTRESPIVFSIASLSWLSREITGTERDPAFSFFVYSITPLRVASHIPRILCSSSKKALIPSISLK